MLPSVLRLPDAAIIKKVGTEKFEDSVAEVYSYLEGSVTGEMSRMEKVALTKQTLRCLKLYMTQTLEIPFTLKTLFDNIHLLDFVVDRCFPYYASNKLLLAVITPAKVA
jgi:hypothetical protein